ncbi:hypothetical protein BO94DRAFT_137600 [Aspergillus sclerotioniger CBS 115572]|uniref:Pentatricopeptide repeat protein n=1 Tax=Aspergillus sclerotioniger CBS 115572 TaxID=1450535 RepID=A0A317XDY5_9EURO|nr:hypothetical protein BO94DRAFT_137600 [Aspergillus sclerotioniger CBS 115572]PWY95827.1 hypothetical protein BO94DRAFT_137600 [Aspergillus sclerotioniger CBS 115572]
MQGLWSRAAPAQSTCRCVSCLSTVSNGVASRTTSAASKRRLRLGNSVTALYTSIFAAAALADAQAKGQRRIEWEEKIAAVKEEVNELVDEEQRLVEALLSRRKQGFLHGALQTRHFGTATRPAHVRYQWPRRNVPFASFHSTTAFANERDSQIIRDLVAESDDPLAEDANEDYGLSLDSDHSPTWLTGDVVRQKVIRKLALKQLAIRLLLRPAIAHSYMGVQMNYGADFSVPQLKVSELLAELNNLRRRMRHVKSSKTSNIDDLAKDLRVHSIRHMTDERNRLDRDIQRDVDLYMRDHMPLQELLLRLANNLMQCTDPDRPEVLKKMILAFTKTRQNDLCDLILKTILPYKFPLSASLILTILTFLRKSKNLMGFDIFLEMLNGHGYPVDLNGLGLYQRQVINGVEIIVPPVDSANPVIYATLIVSCLRFDQPDRADAYLLAARSAGHMDDFAILNSYLRFCAIRTDWEKGVQTLKRTLAFMVSSTEHRLFRLERLIVLMVHMCDACEKYDMSEAIITTAMNSGFDWAAASKQLDIRIPHDPHHRRWRSAAEAAPKEMQDKRAWEKSYAFVNVMNEHLNVYEGKSPSKKWQDMIELYSQQVLTSMLAGSPASSNALNASQPAFEDGDRQKLLLEISKQVERTKQENESAAAAQEQEITSLKAEISQLKQMVFDLHQTQKKETIPPPPPSQPSHHDLLRQKHERMPPTPELGAPLNQFRIRYMKS